MKTLPLPKPNFAFWVVLAVSIMLGFQGLVEFRLLPPVLSEVGQLSDKLKDVHATAAMQKVPLSQPQVQLGDILSRLSLQPSQDERIGRLHRLAAQQGVLLRKASYHNQTMSNDIVRLEIQTEMSGSYPAIRLFLRELLTQDPAAAVQSLEFSRPLGNANAGVRAQVVFGFFAHS